MTIPDEEQDKGLSEKLLAELPGILRWAVEGHHLWRGEGLTSPNLVKKATQGYRDEMDVFASFLSDCCRNDDTKWTATEALYGAYMDWCSQSGEYPVSLKEFTTNLAERGYVAKRRRRRGWYGLALVTDDAYDSRVVV